MKTTLMSETVNMAGGDSLKTIRFSTVEAVIEMLLYDATITIEKVDLVITKHATTKLNFSGPALAGLVPWGYLEKKKGTAWTNTSASKVNGLQAVPDPGSAQSQTLIMSFSPSNGKIFEVNPAVELTLVFADPHTSVKTAGADENHYSVYAIAHVDVS